METVTGAILRSNGWESLQGNMRSFSEKQKGDIFELLTKSYLTLNPIYAAKLKKVWILKDVPADVRSFLNLPNKDMGIDLVAETHDKEYWAIQCKYRGNSDSSLGWGEISTFIGLTFRVCSNFSFALICHTGSRYTELLSKQSRIGFCSNEVWQALDKDFFEQVKIHLQSGAVALKPLTPRPHQLQAIRNAKDYFGFLSTTRGKLIMPCGTGKSLTSFWIAQELGATKILVAVPSLALMKQTLEVWLREYRARGQDKDLSWLCVCSDSTVGEIAKDDFIDSTSNLGIPCTTDEREIFEWLGGRPNSLKIVFTTYQSSKTICQAARQAGFAFNLAILDEAHRTVGDRKRHFSYLLSDENIDIRRRIFMTATERHYRGNKSEIASMNNVAIYGETFHHLSFKDAVTRAPKIIADYRVITLAVSKAEVTEAILKNKLLRPTDSRWSEEIEAKMLASVIALHRAMQTYPIHHAITFHSSIPRAEAFSKYIEAYNAYVPDKVEAYHVHGSMPVGMRQSFLQSFLHSKKSIVTNSRCLVEGVDLPNVDCVLFADPRKSKVDIVQALGRALRPYPGKRHGYIVIPIIVEESGDINDFLESNEFADFISTLRDLASNDERIVEYFQIKTDNGTDARNQNENNKELFNVHFAQNIDVKEFTDAINIQCWDQLSKLSYRPYTSAKRFVQGLGLRSARRLGVTKEKDWIYYCTGKLHGYGPKPIDVPLNPDIVYKDQWEGWDIWLGNKPTGAKSATFEIARETVHRLELKDKVEWEEYVQGKLDGYFRSPRWTYLPDHPDIIYFKEWQGWEDWLGPREYLSFEESRQIVRQWGAKNHKDWRTIVSKEFEAISEGKPGNPGFKKIPWHPNLVYRDKWIDWGDWLGNPSTVIYRQKLSEGKVTPKKKTKYRTYRAGQRFVQTLNLRHIQNWRDYCNGRLKGYPLKPDDIPDYPNKIYKTEWEGWRSWLGPRLTSRKVTFEEARAFARALNLTSVKEWEMYSRGELGSPAKPDWLPSNPKDAYDHEWQGWIDWLVG